MIQPIAYSPSFLGQVPKKSYSEEERATFITKTAHDAVEKYDCAAELIGQINKLMLKGQKDSELLTFVTNLALKTQKDIVPLQEEVTKYRNNVSELIEQNGLNSNISKKIDGVTYSKGVYGPLTIRQHYKGKPYNWDTIYEGQENNEVLKEKRRDQTAHVYFDYHRDNVIEYRFRSYNLNDDYAEVDMDTKNGKIVYISAGRDWTYAPRTSYYYDENEKLKSAKHYLCAGDNLKRDKLDKKTIMTFDDNGKVSTIYYGVSGNGDNLTANAEHIFNRLDDKNFVQIK